MRLGTDYEPLSVQGAKVLLNGVRDRHAVSRSSERSHGT